MKSLTINNMNELYNMVSREEKASPFSVRVGERLQHNQAEYPSGMIITDFDKTILLCINRFYFMSSILLHRLLIRLGMNNISQHDLQLRLKKLYQSAYLNSITFITDENSKCATKVYYLGRRGRGYLTSIGENLCNSTNIARMDAESVKRIMASNQWLVLRNEELNPQKLLVNQILFNTPKDGERASEIFRCSALYQMDNNSLIVESVRLGKEEDFIDKLNRISKVLNTNREKNICLNEPVLLFVCENSTHMVKVADIISARSDFQNINTFYSCDTIIFNNDITDATIQLDKSKTCVKTQMKTFFKFKRRAS